MAKSIFAAKFSLLMGARIITPRNSLKKAYLTEPDVKKGLYNHFRRILV